MVAKRESNKAPVLKAFDTLFNQRDYQAAQAGLAARVHSLIAADILRIENGVLVEHWGVVQDEATEAQSKSGLPMFGDAFPMTTN